MMPPSILNALLIFFLRIIDVSLGTIRMILVVRGMRLVAAGVGFCEVTIWILAVSRVLSRLDSWWSILGYSSGFAAGTLLGIWLEEKLAFGHVTVRVVSPTLGPLLADKIREAGYGATETDAEGRLGEVHVVEIVAPRRSLDRVMDVINSVDEKSFVTIEETRRVVRGYRRMGR